MNYKPSADGLAVFGLHPHLSWSVGGQTGPGQVGILSKQSEFHDQPMELLVLLFWSVVVGGPRKTKTAFRPYCPRE